MNVISKKKKMKQLKLTGFVVFLFFVPESLTLPTQPQDVGKKFTCVLVKECLGWDNFLFFNLALFPFHFSLSPHSHELIYTGHIS